MRFRIEHRIEAPLARVEAALFAPDTLFRTPEFVRAVHAVRLVSRTEEGSRVSRVAVYTPAAWIPLPPRVSREMLAWEERVSVDREAHGGTFSIHPNLPAILRPRFRCEGTYALVDEGPVTLRVVDGEIALRAPLASRLERAAVRIIRQQFDGEAAMLRALS